jgi:hypothetical protein
MSPSHDDNPAELLDRRPATANNRESAGFGQPVQSCMRKARITKPDRKASGTGTAHVRRSLTRISYVAISGTGVLAVTAFAIPSGSASSAPKGVTLSGNPLGVNVAPWQTADLNTTSRQRMDGYFKQLGPAIAVRYGGGVFADANNAKTARNTNVESQKGHQSSNFTGSGSESDALGFPAYASEAKTIGANVMVTINYGTGTPALAGSWLSSIRSSHDPVSEVEIGNEPYGCSSPDLEITQAPVWDTSYEPNVPRDCPYTQAGSGSAGIKWFAKSFIAHGPSFIQAVRKADPSVKVVLPYAISPPRNSGHLWNDAVMSAVKNYQGIDVLWYPSQTTSSPSTQTELSWLTQIPTRAAAVKADVRKYAPGAFWMIGEDNLDNQPTAAVCKPVTAVFAAASALAWLAQGAANVNWWEASDGNNSNGHCKNPDFAMFDRTGYPQPPYKGFLLASKLAQPHAVLSIVNTGNGNVLAYHSTLSNGKQAEAFINISASKSETVAGPSIGSGTLTKLQYRSGHATIVTTKVSSSSVKRITLPIDSVTVLTK